MWDWIGKLAELRRKNQLAVLVTVTKTTGSTPRKQGAKMIVLPDGSFHGTVGGGVPEYHALEEARECLEQVQSKFTEIPLQQKGEFPACGGTMEMYMEVVNSNPSLYLFGAGHIGQDLCQVLEGAPFVVHLIDGEKVYRTDRHTGAADLTDVNTRLYTLFNHFQGIYLHHLVTGDSAETTANTTLLLLVRKVSGEQF